MRQFVNILFIFFTMSAMAFNSSKWDEKRHRITQEAERLQAEYSNCVSQVVEPAENVSIPIENFPNGSVKTLVSAAKAVYFIESGYVLGEDVKVVKMDSTGETDTEISAKHCIIDRQRKCCWIEGYASIRYRSTLFTGENVYFSSSDGYLMVMKHSVITSEDLKLGGIKP